MDVIEVRGLPSFKRKLSETSRGQPVLYGRVHGEDGHRSCRIIKRLRDYSHKGNSLKCGGAQRLLNYQRVNTNDPLEGLIRRKVNTECLQWQQ